MLCVYQWNLFVACRSVHTFREFEEKISRLIIHQRMHPVCLYKVSDRETSSTKSLWLIHPFVHKTTSLTTHIRPAHQHNYTPLTAIHNYNTRRATQGYTCFEQHPNPTNTNTATHLAHYPQKYIKIWNTLPPPLQANTSIHQFKEELKKHLHQKQAFET